jgi:hypothetical protein
MSAPALPTHTASTLRPFSANAPLTKAHAMTTYDSWKARNPQDEQLGPEPPPYNGDDDFEKSLAFAYEAVRERIANGGPPWTPKISSSP